MAGANVSGWPRSRSMRTKATSWARSTPTTRAARHSPQASFTRTLSEPLITCAGGRHLAAVADQPLCDNRNSLWSRAQRLARRAVTVSIERPDAAPFQVEPGFLARGHLLAVPLGAAGLRALGS